MNANHWMIYDKVDVNACFSGSKSHAMSAVTCNNKCEKKRDLKLIIVVLLVFVVVVF